MKQPESIPLSQEARSDRDVVAQVLDGDRESFRILVDRHKARVLGMVGRQIGDREVAEDLSQEIFLKAFQSLATFRGEASFSTWIIKIALNTSNTYLSSKSYRDRYLDSALHADQMSCNRSPQSEHESKELLGQFRRCFAQLGPRFREVVTLCGFEERPYEEVANILLIPTGTVKSRLNKARLLLKDCLAQHLT